MALLDALAQTLLLFAWAGFGVPNLLLVWPGSADGDHTGSVAEAPSWFPGHLRSCSIPSHTANNYTRKVEALTRPELRATA